MFETSNAKRKSPFYANRPANSGNELEMNLKNDRD